MISTPPLGRAAALTAAVPDYAAARGLSLAATETAASLEAADRLGLETFGTGAFGVQDCDSFGRMRPELMLGRIADGILLLIDRLRAIGADDTGMPLTRIGAAALEYRLMHHRWPRAGDRMVVRSGLTAGDARTARMVHWMLDPLSGEPWGTAEAVTAIFDLEARKIVPLSPKGQAKIQPMTVAGLTP